MEITKKKNKDESCPSELKLTLQKGHIASELYASS